MSIKLSIALAFVATVAFADISPTPILNPKTRVQLESPVRGIEFVKTNSGQRLLLTISEIAGAKVVIRAVSDEGKTVSSVEIPKPSGNLSFVHQGLNSAGEVVAITTEYQSGNGTGKMISVNLTKQTWTTLPSSGKWVFFNDRTVIDGKNIALLTQYAGEGLGSNGQHIRLVDEDSGEIVKQLLLPHPVSGKFGTDSQGKLKILLTGFETFAVLDVQTLAITEIVPERTQPSSHPQLKTTSVGQVLEWKNEESLQLLDLQSLFDARMVAVRTLPKDANFVDESTVSVRVGAGTQLVDIATTKELGPVLPDANTSEFRYARVTDILDIDGKKIAALSEAVEPNSFLPGTILSYFDVSTGTLLRRRAMRLNYLSAQLIEGKDGVPLAIESSMFSQNIPFSVVNLTSNAIINETTEGDFFGKVFKSSTGKVLALQDLNDKVCVVNAEVISAKTCIEDSMVSPRVKYGWSPFELDTGRLLLPLVRNSGEVVNSHGFVEFAIH